MSADNRLKEDLVDLQCHPQGEQGPPRSWTFSVSGATDPGVKYKENQDEVFYWVSEDQRAAVACVLDGHGREFGRLAAQTARMHFSRELTTPLFIARMKEDPKGSMEAVFSGAHAAIKDALIAHCTAEGWTVRNVGGILTRFKPQCTGNDVGATESCIHGGTTATVVMIIEGRWVFTAHVGDSTALLMGTHGAQVRDAAEWVPRVEKVVDAPDISSSQLIASQVFPISSSHLQQGALFIQELTRDHSPESPTEWRRVTSFRRHPSSEFQPELLFIYDNLSHTGKRDCQPIFPPPTATGTSTIPECISSESVSSRLPEPSRQGTYYKNLRKEWASLVITPPSALFTDALAFTRSLGDFQLQTYGVSHIPDVTWVDLLARPVAISSGVPLSSSAGSTDPVCSNSPLHSSLVETPSRYLSAIALASDGIWDNWLYESFAERLYEELAVADGGPSESDSLSSTGFANITRLAVHAMMEDSLSRGNINFGDSMDNMSLVLFCFPPPHPQKTEIPK